MVSDASTLQNLIEQAIPGCTARVENLRSDGHTHFAIHVASPNFAGISRVQQHQMVYNAIKNHIDLESIALALQTVEK